MTDCDRYCGLTLRGMLTAAVASALALAGCSAEWHRVAADRQVQRMLREREQETLGYVPQEQAPFSEAAPVKPASDAYDKAPETRMPPPAPPPIVPPDAEVPAGPIGPEMTLPSGTPAPDAQISPDDAVVGDFAELEFGPPAPDDRPMSLNLFESIAYAVRHSRDYQDQSEDLYLAALDVSNERHLFSPRPFARTTAGYSDSRAANDYDSALRVTQSVGVQQQLPYGGEVVAEALVQFVDTLRGNIEGGEDAALALSASIPLLRGAGFVNLEPLIQSERDLIYQVRSFEDFRRDFAVRVADQYFNLLSQQQQIANAIQNRANAANLAERTQALYAAGIIRFTEVQRALQQELQAENRLVEAEVRYQNTVDDYKLLLGMPVDEPLEIAPTDLEVEVPRLTAQAASALAKQYRLDLQTAEDRVEDATRAVAIARNTLLPDLDLAARAEVGNEEGSPARKIDQDTTVYTAEVSLDWPLDRVIERNAYRRALINLEQARRDYDGLVDRVAADARTALRGIRSAEERLRIQRNAIELALRRLENANELLRQGTADSNDVVDAQNDLLDAQNDYEEARANLQTQVLEFLRDTGTLRVDPNAGLIGQAMDRQRSAVNVRAGAR